MLDFISTNMSEFNRDIWPTTRRNAVWNFGKMLNSKSALKLDRLITDRFNTSEFTDLPEMIAFLRIEIMQKQGYKQIKDALLKLSERNPYNPEFLNHIGHYYNEIDERRKAYEYTIRALKGDRYNELLSNNAINMILLYVRELLKEDNAYTARNMIQDVRSMGLFEPNTLAKNHLAIMEDFVLNHMHFDEKMKSTIEDVKSDVAKERLKTIPLLAFFSGVVAFILSGIQIMSNFSYPEAARLLILLGIILTLVVIVHNGTSRIRY